MLKANADSKNDDLLNSLRVAAPCTVDWESMTGGDRTRHCLQCNKNVYNISSMSSNEAEQFLQAVAGQKTCIRFYKRFDDTVLLDNCPVGLRKLRTQYRKIAATVVTIISLFQGFFTRILADESKEHSSREIPVHIRGPRMTMGQMVAEPPTVCGGKIQHSVKNDFQAEAIYRNSLAPLIYAALPKNVDFGDAILYLFVAADGSIVKTDIDSSSPNKQTDQLIIEAMKKLKFSPIPKTVSRLPLCIYYKCRLGEKQVKLPVPDLETEPHFYRTVQ